MYTTQQVAELLGVTTRRVTALIRAGRLPAERYSRSWLIKPRDLEAFCNAAGWEINYPLSRERYATPAED